MRTDAMAMPSAATILIVDDEPLNIDLLEQELADLNYQTVSALSGREALEKVQGVAPDLILLDVMMPGMDGFTVCRLLKEKEETQFIPVVFMTALGEREHRITGIKVGGYDFFTKPPDQQVLLARIQSAIKMKQAVDKRIAQQPQPEKTFRRAGEYWTITYQSQSIHLKDSDGLRYLAYLLRYPHRPIHVLELVASVDGLPEGIIGGGSASSQEGLTVRRGLGDAGELLDPRAKAEYKQRLEELRTELEEAQRCNDVGRIAQAQEELEFLTKELLRAFRLGGKSRRAASPAERARVNVQRAIKPVLQKLVEYHPALGHYLTDSINTGTYCSYTPDFHLPSPWQL